METIRTRHRTHRSFGPPISPSLRHFSRLGIFIGVVVAIAKPSVGHGQENRLVGCYDLTLERWTPRLELGGDSLYVAPPPRIYLDSLPAAEPQRGPEGKEWAHYRRFPREVRLESGRVLALGSTMAEAGFPSQERAGEITVKPVGVFAGATGLQVRAFERVQGQPGRIGSIRLDYPPDVDFARLVERFSDVHGPPTSRWETDLSVTATWSGRDSHVRLSKARLDSGDHQVTFTLLDPRI